MQFLEQSLTPPAEPSRKFPKFRVNGRWIRGLEVEIDAEPCTVSKLDMQGGPTLE